jgi:uncharacterized protein (DUF3084 family)
MAFMNDNKETILAIIDGWRGRLTYDLLSQRLQEDLGLKKTPSRHNYKNHDEVYLAFKLKKKELKNEKQQAIEEAKSLFHDSEKLSPLLANLGSDEATTAELIKWVEKLEKENERLSSENKRLTTQNDILLERFARWQHNLQKMDGVDMNRLATEIDNGLPAKNRD